jgi:hypothetical protein
VEFIAHFNTTLDRSKGYLKSLATSWFTPSIKSKNSFLPKLVEDEVKNDVGNVCQNCNNFFL